MLRLIRSVRVRAQEDDVSRLARCQKHRTIHVPQNATSINIANVTFNISNTFDGSGYVLHLQIAGVGCQTARSTFEYNQTLSIVT